jgi:hypothetical protein
MSVAPGETRKKNETMYSEPRRGSILLSSGQNDEECDATKMLRELKLGKKYINILYE